ncbi:MmgE/PrpD family protein [Ornithinicoccus halotolerans]|uniref:MmgE/PrpD family protein n=1 Tax=Ornithinicoccus halotolerans TaxID=1748220 RepID=UPI001886082C|nr:MmgE/PrpD family protein [Ornithinicoccus halotolerans]
MRIPDPAGFTTRLAVQSLGWSPDGPAREAVLTLAERAVLDTVAVGVAAREDPTVRACLAGLGSLAPGRATVLATGRSAAPRDAALVGGLLCHAFDYDDVDTPTISHPSTVLVPALLAVAEAEGHSPEQVLLGYGAGLLAQRTVAAELGGIEGHYSAGWHATGTIGTLSATAALARLRGLDEGAGRHALGIAGSLAMGSRQNFGTMTKPLHAGIASANAVLATDLAAAGFTADPDQLEGGFGFLRLHHGRPAEDAATVAGPDILGVDVKLYPCCYYTHPTANAVLDLVGQGLRVGDVARVDVTVHPGGLSALIHPRPTTGLQGKFSMEYVVAAALLDGRLTLRTFTDEQVRRAEVPPLLELVHPTTAEEPPFGGPRDGWYATVEVTTTDGRVLRERVDRPRGHATRPVEEADLVAKAGDCLDWGGLEQSLAESLIHSLRDLRQAESVGAALAPLREEVHP